MEISLNKILKIILPSVVLVFVPLISSFLAIPFLVVMMLPKITAAGSYEDIYKQVTEILSTTEATVIVAAVEAVFIVLVFGVWYYIILRREKKSSDYIAIECDKINFFNLAMGVILLIPGLSYVVSYLGRVLTIFFPDWVVSTNSVEISAIKNPILAITAIVAIILFAIGNELAYRGITRYYAKAVMSEWYTISICAILYAGMAQGGINFITRCIVGFILGYIAHHSRSVALVSIISVGVQMCNIFGRNLMGIALGPVAFYIVFFTSMSFVYIGLLLIKSSFKLLQEDDKSKAID